MYVIRATFFVQLVAQQCCVARWDGLLRVLPPSCATNFHVAKNKSYVYILQHKNLLRKKVVIRATNYLNLQSNIVAGQVARKMLPVLLGLNTWMFGAFPWRAIFFVPDNKIFSRLGWNEYGREKSGPIHALKCSFYLSTSELSKAI